MMRIDQILNVWSFFRFSQLIGNITISGNCCVRFCKSYMHEHFCFFSLTKCWYTPCIQKCIRTCRKYYNQKVNYLTDHYLYTDKKNSSNMVLTFTVAVAQIYVCVKWLLIVSYLSCTQTKSMWESTAKKLLHI